MTHLLLPHPVPACRSMRLTMQPGKRIWWDSPLFGHCSGVIVSGPWLASVLIRQHIVTEGCAWIPVRWIEGTLQTNRLPPEAHSPSRSLDVLVDSVATRPVSVQGELFDQDDDAQCLKL